MDPSPTISTHTRCDCAYDLHGLDWSRACPECGRDIQKMLARRKAMKTWERRFIRRSHQIVVGGMAALFCVNFVLIFYGFRWFRVYAHEIPPKFIVIWIVVAVPLIAFIIVVSAAGQRHGRNWIALQFVLYVLFAGLMVYLNHWMWEVIIASI